MRTRTATVVPLTPEELERAIDGPAARVGVVPELALVAEMVADVSERPGALPLLQYALTELFEARRADAMTLEAYREIGGVSGALARRAEELFDGLDREERRATKQVFLRLVTVDEGAADTRRLVLRSELLSLPLDRGAIERAIDAFGRHRLLAFDRDPDHARTDRRGGARGAAPVVGPSATLDRRRAGGSAPASSARGRDRGLGGVGPGPGPAPPGTPAGGARRRGRHRASSSCPRRSRTTWPPARTSATEELHEETERAERERTLERRSLVRLRALVGVLTAAALVAAGLTTVAVSRARESERLRDQAELVGIDQLVARQPRCRSRPQRPPRPPRGAG